MIKIAATLSKKVPLPGVEYSSQSYGASMEIEISDADKPEAIKDRINQLYSLLGQTIDEQIAGGSQQRNGHAGVQQAPARALPLPQQPTQRVNNGQNRVAATQSTENGNGRRGVSATEAQCRAIFAMCKSQNLDMASVLQDFNVSDARDLNVKDASRLIDQLKQNGNGAAAH